VSREDKNYIETLQRCLAYERSNNEYLLEKVSKLENQNNKLRSDLKELSGGKVE
jgi:BMFP domain-containing protein YqiC